MTDSKQHEASSAPGLKATEFSPLEAPESHHGRKISPGLVIIGVLSLAALLIMAYLFAARAVIFEPDPANAEIQVGGLSFNIGNNFLLLRGDHTVSAIAQGYYPFEEEVTVTEQRSQEIPLELAPLPGRIELLSDLDDVLVSIDGEPAGMAPGTVEEVSRGSHILEFAKHRYFDSKQEIEVEGLGKTETVDVVLEPAWGQMQFSTVPDGVELSIDGELIGQTPLVTEVLETGSQLNLALRGYKTIDKQIFIQAGTEQDYPEVTMIVADGRLRVSSNPSGASVTVGGEFRGATPTGIPLSPLRSHRIELYLEGYHKSVRTVQVEPEKTSNLAIDLTPIIGRVQLSIQPADSEIMVDGRSNGRGSQTLSLTAREHTIVIQKPGYASQSFKVVPRPELEQSLDVSLLTIQDDYWSTRPPLIVSPVGSQLKLFKPTESFTLGAARREPGRRANEAERNVQLERPFYVGTYEVTNAEFRRWKEEHSSRAFRAQTLDMDSQPAVNMAWVEAAYFCNWLSRQEGLPEFYIVENGLVTGIELDAHGYRMPTEAEWAWVAKIDEEGQTLMFPWGTTEYPPSEVIANYSDRSAVTLLSFTLSNYNDGFAVSAKTGSFPPNSKGIYDLSGNVAEWTSDFYDIRPSRGAPELDPTGPESGNRHVIRGASWAMGSRSELRLSYRDAGADPRMDTGFRLARYVDKAGVKQ
jgi:formylglycine-generating enzyme required for sulfatase activity